MTERQQYRILSKKALASGVMTELLLVVRGGYFTWNGEKPTGSLNKGNIVYGLNCSPLSYKEQISLKERFNIEINAVYDDIEEAKKTSKKLAESGLLRKHADSPNSLARKIAGNTISDSSDFP